MILGEEAGPVGEGDGPSQEILLRVNRNVDDASSSSSSDSESDEDAAPVPPTGNSAVELTLVDDASPSLVQPDDEGEGEGEGEGKVAMNATYDNEYYGEMDGEGTGEAPSHFEADAEDKREADKKKKKKKKKKWLSICLTNCKYDVVRRNSRKFGFKEVSDDEDWTLYWTDFSVALDRVMEMKNYQKINHFPGMNEICRKDMLARNLNRMQKTYPKEYNVFPKTWCLPADYGDFQAYTRQKKNKTYILKPESGCQGKGIWVTKNPKEIRPHEHMICQVYMNKPFLIDGFKFDLRIYTLVTSCDPLRIFVFKDGLARFATNKYCEPTHNNTDNVYMHLTNYAINKHSEDFIRDDEAGSKRRISTISRYLNEKGYDVDRMWADIDDVIIKTVISAHSVLRHNYRSCFPNHIRGSACFEILGIDILLDKKLKPSILEVNHSPSFTTDAQLDREIKGTLIYDTLRLINFGAVDRRKCLDEERRRIKDRLLGKYVKKETKEELEAAQTQYLEQLERYEDNHLGNFRRIFPMPGTEKYDKFFHSSGTLFQETAAFRARQELARAQREELLRKKEKNEMMLKGKGKKDGVRPESPGRKRRLSQRPTLPLRHLNSQRQHAESHSAPSTLLVDVRESEPVDTLKPQDIVEDEELERLSGLLQRDNLVRGLGIVEHVYRLLHCTPGTMGVVRPEQRPGHGGVGHSHTLLFTHQSSLASRSLRFSKDCYSIKMFQRLEKVKRELDLCKPIPNKAKDTNYYKSLLDRYFGPNHVLSKKNAVLKLQRTLSASTPAVCFINREHDFPHVKFSASSSSQNKSTNKGGSHLGVGANVPAVLDHPIGAAYPLVLQSNQVPFQQLFQQTVPGHRTASGDLAPTPIDSQDATTSTHHYGTSATATTATTASHTLHHQHPTNPAGQHYNRQSLYSPSDYISYNPTSLSAFRMLSTSNTVNATNSLIHPYHTNHTTRHHAASSASNAITSTCAVVTTTTTTTAITTSTTTTNHPNSHYNYNYNSSYPSHQSNVKYDHHHIHASPVTTVFSKSSLIELTVTSPAVPSSPNPSSAHHLNRGRRSAPGSSSSKRGNHHSSHYQNRSPTPTLSVSSFPSKSTSNLHNHPASAYPTPQHISSFLNSTAFLPSSSTSAYPYRLAAKRHQVSSFHQPSYTQRWQNKGSTLSNLNERTLPAYQRSKLSRKPLGAAARPGPVAATVQEVEYRSMASMLETEAERNRLLAKTGYQPEWRSDNSTPSRMRNLSAKQRDSELAKYMPQQVSQGLSVVSAPAPVSHRPDIVSPSGGVAKMPPPQVIAPDTNLRSTKTQRIRGASNSIRLRQLEMRENHAFVHS